MSRLAPTLPLPSVAVRNDQNTLAGQAQGEGHPIRSLRTAAQDLVVLIQNTIKTRRLTHAGGGPGTAA
jgi:hypothetical protein